MCVCGNCYWHSIRVQAELQAEEGLERMKYFFEINILITLRIGYTYNFYNLEYLQKLQTY